MSPRPAEMATRRRHHSHHRFGATFLSIALAALVGLVVIGRELRESTIGIPANDLPSAGETTLLIGLIILGSWLSGRLIRKIGLPPITGQLFFGVLIGPGFWSWLQRPELALINPTQLADLRGAELLALVMIGLVAGSEIDGAFVRARFRAIATLAIGQVAVVSTLVGLVTWAMLHSPVQACLFATLAATCSSAVSVALLREMRHPTEFARLLLATTVTKDLLLVLTFSIVLFIVSSGSTTTHHSWYVVVLHLAGSIGVGFALAFPLAMAMRRMERRMTGIVLVTAIFILMCCQLTSTAPLVVALTLGYFAHTIAPIATASFFATARRLFLPVCCVFFCAAGAHMDLAALFANWSLVLMLCGTRLIAVWSGATAAARMAGLAPAAQRWAWAGFVPQAGISLALAAQVTSEFPQEQWAISLATVMIACITLNEIIGPILMRLALRRVP